jgi:hypothetical protein
MMLVQDVIERQCENGSPSARAGCSGPGRDSEQGYLHTHPAKIALCPCVGASPRLLRYHQRFGMRQIETKKK